MQSQEFAIDSQSHDLAADGRSGALPLRNAKVLIIVENLPVPFDRRVWQEARSLTSAGAQVAVICPTGKGYEKRYEYIDGIHIYRHRLPMEGAGALGYVAEYSAALFGELVLSMTVLFRHGFDVVQICNPPDLLFLVALIYKLFGKKCIFDHHDITPELFEAKFGRRGLFWRLMVIVERLTFATADVCIATNNSYRQIAIERGRKSPEDIFVVRSGPDLNKVKAVSPSDRWKNGRKYLVGYVGVMGRQEGIDLLLRCVRSVVLSHGREDIHFCLVGAGPALNELREECSAMQLDDYVTFAGRLPDHELFEMLSTADVCVNPDRVNVMNDKSTMNKILEYMAFGKPIVQFDVTEGRFSAGEASLYAIPNDPEDMALKILGLLSDDELRQAKGTLGRERVEKQFSWAHQIPNLIDAYKRALGRS